MVNGNFSITISIHDIKAIYFICCNNFTIFISVRGDMEFSEEVKIYMLSSVNKSGILYTPRNIPPFIKDVLSLYSLTFKELFYLIKYNLNDFPKCPICGNPIKYFYIHTHPTYCSIKCAQSDTKVREKVKKTNIERYGVENVSQSKEVQAKMKNTCLERYGVECSLSNKEVREKVRNTLLDRYGVENASQSVLIKNKKKATMLDHYGVEYPYQSEDIRNKRNASDIEKYGDIYTKTKECRDKMKETCIARYGVEYSTQSEQMKNKTKETNLSRYGVENVCQNKQIRAKNTQSRRLNNFDNFIKNLLEKGIEFLDTKENYCLCDRTLELQYKCLKCDSLFKSSGLKYQQIYCPVCAKQRYSQLEKEVVDYVKSIYSNEVLENVRNIIPNRELDIYIPKLKLAIEFNGTYWHSDIYKNSNYHLDKTNLCKENGITLIHIFEHEWSEKQDICKSLIASSLGVYNQIIDSNCCDMFEISNNVYEKFIKENSIIDYKDCEYRYGLFHNTNLICVVGLNYNNNYYTLENFCVKMFTLVNNGLYTLLTNINNTDIIVNIDKSKFSENDYLNNHFIIEGDIDPTYIDINGYKLYNCGYIIGRYRNE